MPGPALRLALFEPEIAGNVGTLLRTAACLGVGADLIEPLGFPFGDRAMTRAGMDYLAKVALCRHADWNAFEGAVTGRIVLLTTRADAVPLPAAAFRGGDTLLLGSESRGVPEKVQARADLRVRVPMRTALRSLNVAVAGAIALADALRQLDAWPG